MTNQIKIWVNKIKESKVKSEYKDAGIINIDISGKINLSSNIRENWYSLGAKMIRPMYEDLFILSLVVFAVDKRIARKNFSDAWTRSFKINVPVLELKSWEFVRNDLNKMLSYLSGDKWEFEFRKCENDLRYKSSKKRESTRPKYLDNIKAVSLYSGGLDSFCGAYKLLSSNISTLFVGFQEYGKLKNLQKELLDNIKSSFQNTFCEFFSFTARALALRNSNMGIKDSENTSRSRSFLFLCAAISVAGIVGENIPVYIPENGFIGLNLPMTLGRIGSCSTRTTHPYFLNMFNSLLKKIGINHTIINPYAYSTKREMVNENKNNKGFIENYYKTISCSHPCNGRWEGYSIPQNCGYCYPCLIRRSSLLDIDTSKENYGYDVLSSNYINTVSEIKRSDLEDILSSIIMANKLTDSQLKRRIAMTGKLSIEEINQFLRVYRSTISDLMEVLSRNKEYKKLLGA